MKHMVLAGLFAVCASGLVSQALPGDVVDPEAVLQEAIDHYDAGEYEECGNLIDTLIGLVEAGEVRFIQRSGEAEAYLYRALVSYAFREEGYQDQVRADLERAVEVDLDFDLPDPSRLPPLVIGYFQEVRAEYLARYTKTAKRSQLGLYGSLIVDPTVLTNPLLLQPGIYAAYALSENWSLQGGLGIPVVWPPWNSIRGRIGFIWHPAYRVERFSSGISSQYLFTLNDLSVLTHSLSFGFRGEYVLRGGAGLMIDAELLRADLVFGATVVPELPGYSPLSLFADSFIRVAFANTRFAVFWNY